MTKNIFLRKLRIALWGGFSRGEREDVISDYEGFFEQGKSDGKNESDIAEELGDPRVIALNLAEESGKLMPAGALVLKYSERIRYLLGIFIFFGSLWVFLGAYSNMNAFYFYSMLLSSVNCVVLMTVALYLVLKRKMSKADFRRGLAGFIFANAVIGLLALLCIVFFNSTASLDLAFWALENVNSPWITNGITEIRKFCMVVAICIGVWSVLAVWRGKTGGFISAVHAIGFYMYLETLYLSWQYLDSIDEYWIKTPKVGLVYLAGIIIAALSVLIIKKGAVKNG
jgi:uncharacterized membrane protein